MTNIEMATLRRGRELAKCAARVLGLQKKYFSTRERTDLIASKTAEKELSQLANRFLEDFPETGVTANAVEETN